MCYMPEWSKPANLEGQHDLPSCQSVTSPLSLFKESLHHMTWVKVLQVSKQKFHPTRLLFSSENNYFAVPTGTLEDAPG